MHVILVIIVGALIWVVFLPLLEYFPVSARGMSLLGMLIGLCGIGLGTYWANEESHAAAEYNARVHVQCKILESKIKHRSQQKEIIDAYLRVTWHANGKPFTIGKQSYMKAPFFSVGGNDKKRANLQANYAPGKSFRCFYNPDKPSWVYHEQKQDKEDIFNRQSFAWAIAAVGALLLFGFGYRFKQSPANEPYVNFAKLKSDMGIYLVLMGFVVMKLTEDLGAILMWSSAIALWVVGGFIAWRNLKAEESIFTALQHSLTDFKYWPPEDEGSDTDDEINPYESDRVIGNYNGVTVGLGLYSDGLEGFVALPDWPVSLTSSLQVMETDKGVVLPDSNFSDLIYVSGPENEWRPLLTYDIRATLTRLLSIPETRIDQVKRELRFNIQPADLNIAREILDCGVYLAEHLREIEDCGGEQVLLNTIRQEGHDQLRLDNYVWLTRKNATFRSKAIAEAKTDPNPAVQLWLASETEDRDTLEALARNDQLESALRVKAWMTLFALVPTKQAMVEQALLKLLLRVDDADCLDAVVEALGRVGTSDTLKAMTEEKHRIPEETYNNARTSILSRMQPVDGGELALTEDGGELTLSDPKNEGALAISEDHDDS